MLKDGPVWALGTMSGTSLDGVDAAMVQTDGESIRAFGETGYRPYTDAERKILRNALGQWDDVQAAAEIVENAHAELLSTFEGADIIGFHGQTLAHDPGGRGTFQAGNGALLAEVLETPVVWDFRSNDVAMGGQGAPLAPFFHFACGRWIGAQAPVAFLNLGGIGNVTWLDPHLSKPDDPGALLAFDTGPANAPLDDFMQSRLGRSRDEGGQLAATGQVDEQVVSTFLNTAFFHRLPPKSLDRGDFVGLEAAVADLSDADAAATLCAVVAKAVVQGCDYFPSPPTRILVSGGGRHNRAVMDGLGTGLALPVDPVEAVGLDGDMLEAQAFAHLAVRVARGLPTSCPTTTGVAAAIGGGQISRPSGGQFPGQGTELFN